VSCNDHKLMRQTLQAIPVNRPKPRRRHPQHLCLKSFDHDEPRALAQEFGFTRHRRTCSEEAKDKRWVVEPTYFWLNCLHSTLIRWTTNPANSLARLHLACGVIAWHHALPG
jgi:hypothetical protein